MASKWRSLASNPHVSDPNHLSSSPQLLHPIRSSPSPQRGSRAHSVRKETTLSSESPQKSMTAEFRAWIPYSLGLKETRASMWIEGVGYREPVPTHPVRWPVLLLPHERGRDRLSKAEQLVHCPASPRRALALAWASRFQASQLRTPHMGPFNQQSQALHSVVKLLGCFPFKCSCKYYLGIQNFPFMYAPLVLIPSSPHALLCHRDFRETKQGVTPLLCSVILRDQSV